MGEAPQYVVVGLVLDPYSLRKKRLTPDLFQTNLVGSESASNLKLPSLEGALPILRRCAAGELQSGGLPHFPLCAVQALGYRSVTQGSKSHTKGTQAEAATLDLRGERAMKEREEGHSLADSVCPIRDRREIIVNLESPTAGTVERRFDSPVRCGQSLRDRAILGDEEARKELDTLAASADSDRWPATRWEARVFLDHASGYVMLERGRPFQPVDWPAIQLIEAARRCVIAGDRCCPTHEPPWD